MNLQERATRLATLRHKKNLIRNKPYQSIEDKLQLFAIEKECETLRRNQLLAKQFGKATEHAVWQVYRPTRHSSIREVLSHKDGAYRLFVEQVSTIHDSYMGRLKKSTGEWVALRLIQGLDFPIYAGYSTLSNTVLLHMPH